MSDIKTKKKNKVIIRKLDKGKIFTQKAKNNIVRIRDKSSYENKIESETPVEYSINKFNKATNRIAKDGITTINKFGKKSVNTTSKNIQKVSKKIQEENWKIKKKTTDKAIKSIDNSNKTIMKKSSEKSFYPKKTNKRLFKNFNQKNNVSFKSLNHSMKLTKNVNISTIKNKQLISKKISSIKRNTKAITKKIKGMLAISKGIITAIIAGGWVSAIIIIIMCFIGLFCSSIYGIFFSSEDNGSSLTMSSAIREINQEYNTKITDIQTNNEYDEYEINSNIANWKDILILYVVLINNGDNPKDVVTIDEDKFEKLKEIFWKMNTIDYKIEEVEKESEEEDEEEVITKKILYIEVTSKTIDEMIEIYNLDNEQISQITELEKEEYNSLWYSVIYGSSTSTNNIIKIAQSQIGNIGGEKFWRWYGFESRVEWCACFVSWCAEQCGYIEAGIIPKFSNCESGISWFKGNGLWQERWYIPQVGDIIFFDWENDGIADHVGIVEKIENERVYTIEGNSDDSCKENNYDINSQVIKGYGTPIY